VEGIDDAHNGAKEADERSYGGDGGEPRHAALHGGEGFARGGLGGTFECNGVAGKTASAVLTLVFIVNLGEDGDQRAGFELVGYGRDLAEASRFAKGAEEALALSMSSAEAGPFGKHDGPGHDAGEKQDEQDSEGDGAAVVNHLYESAAVGGHGGRGRGVFLEEVHCKSEGTNHSCCPPEVSVNRGWGKRGRESGWGIRCGAGVVANLDV